MESNQQTITQNKYQKESDTTNTQQQKQAQQENYDQWQQKIQEKQQTHQNRFKNIQQEQQIQQIKDNGGQVQQVPVQTIQIDPDAELLRLQKQDMQEAKRLKGQATNYFKQQNYNDAVVFYEQSLHYTEDKSFRSTILSNIGICYIKNNQYSKATKYCENSLKQDQSNKKARMNLGRCYESQQKFEQALEQYKKIKMDEGTPLTPGDTKFIKDKINLLQKKVQQINQKRKEEVIGGLKNIGNSLLGYFGMSLDNFKMEKGQNGGYNIQFKQ